MKYKTTFEVMGSGRFPVDMLRYDSCFPDREIDSTMIHREDAVGDRIVQLVKYHHDRECKLTAARWNSFGWAIYSIRNPEKL